MTYTYTYSIANLPEGKVNPLILETEINESDIVTSLAGDRVKATGGTSDNFGVITGGTLTITFQEQLSQADKTTLDGGVSQTEEDPPLAGSLLDNHDNSPNEQLTQKVQLKENHTTVEGLLYTVPHPQSLGLEMCDRDILLKTATFDATATVTISGVDTDGDILYRATWPGSLGNKFAVTHETGATGTGNENRALAAVLTPGTTWDLVVTFGTDGSGNSVTPTANDIISLINADTSIVDVINAAPVGSGASNSSTAAQTSLTGGTSNSLEDIKIDPITYTKGAWFEVQQVGVFKDDGGGGYVQCADQTDATNNAILSVWRYLAIDQITGAPCDVELRDGYMIVDSALSDSLDHQAYAIGAPQIPASLGGQVLQFDAYLKFFKGEMLGATSPQAKAMTPNGPAGRAAAELRIYVYYPSATQNNHILRLVTYRPPATF